jgi:hypothetical protein
MNREDESGQLNECLKHIRTNRITIKQLGQNNKPHIHLEACAINYSVIQVYPTYDEGSITQTHTFHVVYQEMKAQLHKIKYILK